ncbi:hypothetical protein DFQ12_2068 [Sphingobacterium detergens]|uniref:Uncharacterized protein n=1 Tax=Sphingobacterium detergens TaxID=1145106 RepID=A0A420BKG4_SPHD1|nr:hypothetical protein DFQ12_2068 [Sphingobacterium detergens]
MSKLEKLKNYVDSELINALPVGFRNLEYRENNGMHSIKVVCVARYKTKQYNVISHFKPISKCLTNL